MNVNRGFFLVAAALAVATACQSTSPPASPSAAGTLVELGTGPGGSSLKAYPVVPQSPVGGVTVSTLTPTLVATGGGLTYSSIQPQYRFRVIDTLGNVTVDSGLVNGGTWGVTPQLTPLSSYTWIARAEYQGLVGPWSTSASFVTPVPPGNDYGNWEQACGSNGPGQVLVACLANIVRPTDSVTDFEVTKRVAWILRASGGGLLKKGSGENVVPWLGVNYSSSRVCYPYTDGHLFKIFSDAGPGGANTPGWGDNDFTDPTSCVPAIDPRLR